MPILVGNKAGSGPSSTGDKKGKEKESPKKGKGKKDGKEKKDGKHDKASLFSRHSVLSRQVLSCLLTRLLPFQ
jgi:hypothetical protein